MIDNLIEDVRDLLDRYTSDESGEHSRDEFNELGDLDILQLIVNTIENGASDLERLRDDFDTDVIINFDYHNY